jgi:hypothetical protein
VHFGTKFAADVSCIILRGYFQLLAEYKGRKESHRIGMEGGFKALQHTYSMNRTAEEQSPRWEAEGSFLTVEQKGITLKA